MKRYFNKKVGLKTMVAAIKSGDLETSKRICQMVIEKETPADGNEKPLWRGRRLV